MLRIFGLGKRRCKECGSELSDMEDVRDRVDDLMRASAYAAEPLENICARCRVLLAKGSPSLQANLHVIEAQRIEAAELELEQATAAEPAQLPAFESEPAAPDDEYVCSDGYKTAEEMLQERIDDYQQIRSAFPESTVTMVLDWLVNTTIGKNVLVGGFFLLIIIFNAVDGDEDSPSSPSADVPYEASEQPLTSDSNDSEMPPQSGAPTEIQEQPAVIPASNPGSWVTTADYPSRALRQEREGITAFRLAVGVDGRPTACTVTESSGHADLDNTTCKALMRSARFQPITEGGPASWSSRVRWQIPK